MLESLFSKVRLGLLFYLKDTPTQVFPCEYSVIFKSSYLEEHLRTVIFKETDFRELMSAEVPAKVRNQRILENFTNF